MAARKAPKKAATKKPAASRKSKTTAASRKSKTTAASGKSKTTTAAAQPKAASKKREAISALAVNRGHLFALRPRVSTAFRPEDFLAAKRLLADETYDSIQAAARAVAERALTLSNEPKTKRDFNPSR